MFWKLLAGFMTAGALIWLLHCLKGVMLTPVQTGRHTDCAVRLSVNGREPRLEETLRGLLWLRQNGTLPCRIVIANAGMDGETELAARLAAQRWDCIELEGFEEKGPWEKPQPQ